MSRHPETKGRHRTLDSLSVVALVVLGLLWWARLSGMSLLERLTGYRPTTSLKDGIQAFVDWYRAYTST